MYCADLCSLAGAAVVADSLWHLSFPGHSALKKPPQVSGSARIRKVGVCTVPRKNPKREVKWDCDVVCACRPPLTPTVSKVPVICRTNHRQFWQRNVERYSAACCRASSSRLVSSTRSSIILNPRPVRHTGLPNIPVAAFANRSVASAETFVPGNRLNSVAFCATNQAVLPITKNLDRQTRMAFSRRCQTT